jgi:hypothetical protein
MAINNILSAAVARQDLTASIRTGSSEKPITPTSNSSLSALQTESSTFSADAPEAISPASSVELTTTFTQDIGGEKISSSVSKSNGEYVATAPTPPGARAHGSTIEVAEYYLKVKLDAIV